MSAILQKPTGKYL